MVLLLARLCTKESPRSARTSGPRALGCFRLVFPAYCAAIGTTPMPGYWQRRRATRTFSKRSARTEQQKGNHGTFRLPLPRTYLFVAPSHVSTDEVAVHDEGLDNNKANIPIDDVPPGLDLNDKRLLSRADAVASLRRRAWRCSCASGHLTGYSVRLRLSHPQQRPAHRVERNILRGN